MLENIAHLYIWNSCSCILMMAIFFPHSHFSFCRPLFLFCSCFLFHSHAPFGFCFRFGAVVVVSGGGISFYSVCVATDTFGRWRTRCFFFFSFGPKWKISTFMSKKTATIGTSMCCSVFICHFSHLWQAYHFRSSIFFPLRTLCKLSICGTQSLSCLLVFHILTFDTKNMRGKEERKREIAFFHNHFNGSIAIHI